jgi:hypothetical protein
MQGHLQDNTRHSQGTDIHVPGGIRTHDPSKKADTGPLLRPRGNWDRQHEQLEVLTAIKAVCVVTKIWTSNY